MGLFQSILDFFKGLLPSPDLPTPDFLARLAGFLSVILVLFAMFNYTVSGTVLGARWGLERRVVDVPNLSHLEFTKNQREVWQTITQLREQDSTIESAFVVVLYNIENGNILIRNEIGKSQPLLWTASLPTNKFNSIDIIETAIAKVKPSFQERFAKSKECLAAKLTGEPLQILKRGISNLKSTHFAACPMYALKGDFAIGAAFIFLELPPDPLEIPPVVGVKPDDHNYELFTLWAYKDRLKRATALIDNNFRAFDKPYSFYWR